MGHIVVNIKFILPKFTIKKYENFTF